MSKFRPEWGYLQEDGEFRHIAKNSYLGFNFVGLFGHEKPPDPSVFTTRVVGARDVGLEYTKGAPRRANFLLLQPLGGRPDRFSKGMAVSYYSWLSHLSCPDKRGGVPINFKFLLPEQERHEFLKALKKNHDLVEDIFQSVYPGLTGENGAKRLIVDKLALITPDNQVIGGLIKPVMTSFSHPVGETPWIGLRGELLKKGQ